MQGNFNKVLKMLERRKGINDNITIKLIQSANWATYSNE